jgi:predicted nucleotidyltransferase
MTSRGSMRLPEPEVLSVARQVSAIARRTIGDPAYRAVLFGSWASGTARQRSDIDIGIEGPSGVDPAAMQRIREACDALPTLYTIELVDLARVPPEFRKHVLSQCLPVEPD